MDESWAAFLYTLSDVRDRSLPAINSQDVTYFIVDKGDDRPIEIKRNNAQSDEEAQFGIGAWYMPQPYKSPWEYLEIDFKS